jgi:hypothetical protein
MVGHDVAWEHQCYKLRHDSLVPTLQLVCNSVYRRIDEYHSE